MKTVKQPVTETKICFDPQVIDGILDRMDKDPSVAPKGLSQIDFFYNLAHALRYGGEAMEVTVERDVQVPDDDETVGNKPVEVPVDGGVKVWSAEEEEDLFEQAQDQTEAVPVTNAEEIPES